MVIFAKAPSTGRTAIKVPVSPQELATDSPSKPPHGGRVDHSTMIVAKPPKNTKWEERSKLPRPKQAGKG